METVGEGKPEGERKEGLKEEGEVKLRAVIEPLEEQRVDSFRMDTSMLSMTGSFYKEGRNERIERDQNFEEESDERRGGGGRDPFRGHAQHLKLDGAYGRGGRHTVDEHHLVVRGRGKRVVRVLGNRARAERKKMKI